MTDAPFLSLPPGGLEPSKTWWIESTDGVRLRAALWRAADPQGHVLLFSGRTEYLEKVAVPAAAWVARGYTVASLDWRGQGLSDHLVEPHLKGHVGDFAEFQRDVDALVATPEVAALGGRRILMAHSMGGAIATATLARPEMRDRFDVALLCSPMMNIKLGKVMRVASRLTVKIGLALGHAESWPPFGDMATPYVLSEVDPPSDNVLTHDLGMWDWMGETARTHPELALAMPTIGWFAAVDSEVKRMRTLPAPDCPVLYLVGSGEVVVDPDEVHAAATRNNAPCIVVQGAKHELLIEEERLRQDAWRAIDAFLDAAAS